MAEQELPGSFYQKRGRWYWCVKLPGHTDFQNLPLKPSEPDGSTSRHATKERNVAISVAKNIYEAARLRDSSWDGTVAGLVSRYRRHAETYYLRPDGTQTAQVGNVKYATEPLAALNIPVENLGPKAVKEILNKWASERLCRSTINDRLHIIQHMFRWGVGEQLVSPITQGYIAAVESLHKGRSKATEPVEVDPVAPSVVRQTQQYMPKVVADMVELHMLTGMRSQEVCQLQPGLIDRTDPATWIYMVPDIANKEHHLEGKKHDRRVPLATRAQAILSTYLLRKPDAYCFTPSEAMRQRHEIQRENRQTPVWPSHLAHLEAKRTGAWYKDRFDTHSYRRAVVYAISKGNREIRKALKKTMPKATKDELAAAFKKAAIPDWTPHQLRHTAATFVRAAMGEFGKDAGMALLGQKSLNIFDRYAKLNDTLAAQAAHKVDAI